MFICFLSYASLSQYILFCSGWDRWWPSRLPTPSPNSNLGQGKTGREGGGERGNQTPSGSPSLFPSTWFLVLFSIRSKRGHQTRPPLAVLPDSFQLCDCFQHSTFTLSILSGADLKKKSSWELFLTPILGLFDWEKVVLKKSFDSIFFLWKMPSKFPSPVNPSSE